MEVKSYGTLINKVIYIGTANMEIVDGRELTYVYADGHAIAMHEKTVAETESMYYLHTDIQGSLMAITDQDGYFLEEKSYDAWGRLRYASNWTYIAPNPFGTVSLTMRGYTFHEHLDEYGLINMNGRLYDPILGRMLSPDNYVQAPDNFQNFNRYSYCLNNPLKYTDPSGNIIFTAAALIAAPLTGGASLAFLPAAIGADIGMWQGGSMANGTMNPLKWDYSSVKTWSYMAAGAAIGGVSGGAANAVATSGIAGANTLAIITGSLINSVGTHIYTGGQTDVNIGFGSYNASKGTFDGIWNWNENSGMENFGYSLGAFANVSDAYSIAMGGYDDAVLNSRNHSKIMDKSGKELFNPGMEFNIALEAKKLKWYEGLVFKRDLITNYVRPDKPNKVENLIERNQLIRGINLKRLATYKNKVELKGNFMIGNLTPIGATNCAGWTSSALLASGVFNIPIAIPGLLSLQMYARQYSYFSYNLIR